MTLEEHIADEKQRIDSLLKSASKLKPDDVTIRKLYEEGAEEHREKAELLEELRVLREEPLTLNLTDVDIETLKRLMKDCKPQILYEDTTIEVLDAKSQNKLANEVWELYEKYHPYLASRVLEFGDELKDLLGKYQEGEE